MILNQMIGGRNIKTRHSIMWLIGFLLISGCSEKAPAQVEGNLKILYWDEDMFTKDFGFLILSTFPDLDYDVVPLAISNNGGKQELFELINREQPDLVMMRSYEEYLQYIDQGILESLDPYIASEEFKVSSYNAGVIQMLRDNEDHTLYGLSPNFSSKVLYYNKDLFDKYKIELPRDYMTWDEVFMLANQFLDKDDIVGFSAQYSAYDLIENIGKTYGLQIISADSEQNITILKNEEEWEHIFTQVTNVIHNKSASLPETEGTITQEMMEKELFINGYSAMTIDQFSLLKRYDGLNHKFNIGLVTVPIDPQYPESTYAIRTDNVFGINKHSNKKKEAWEVLQLINGERAGEIRSKITNTLSTRMNEKQEYAGLSLDPFYALTFDNRKFYTPDVSMQFRGSFYEMTLGEMNELFLNRQSVEATIQNIQEKGTELLLQEKLRMKKQE